MATLRDYFDSNPRCLRQHCSWTVRHGSNEVQVDGYLDCDFEANAKYWSVYLPAFVDPVFAIKALIRETTLKTGEIPNDPAQVFSGDGTGQMTSKADLVFTHRALFYVEDDVSQQIPELQQFAASVNLRPLFYGSEYVKNRSAAERPLAFISHDSRDKESIARALPKPP